MLHLYWDLQRPNITPVWSHILLQLPLRFGQTQEAKFPSRIRTDGDNNTVSELPLCCTIHESNDQDQRGRLKLRPHVHHRILSTNGTASRSGGRFYKYRYLRVDRPTNWRDQFRVRFFNVSYKSENVDSSRMYERNRYHKAGKSELHKKSNVITPTKYRLPDKRVI